MTKFCTNDQVIVRKPSNFKIVDSCCWTNCLDKYVGKQYKVSQYFDNNLIILADGDKILVDDKRAPHGWRFHEDWLELVKSDAELPTCFGDGSNSSDTCRLCNRKWECDVGKLQNIDDKKPECFGTDKDDSDYIGCEGPGARFMKALVLAKEMKAKKQVNFMRVEGDSGDTACYDGKGKEVKYDVAKPFLPIKYTCVFLDNQKSFTADFKDLDMMEDFFNEPGRSGIIEKGYYTIEHNKYEEMGKIIESPLIYEMVKKWKKR